MVIQIACLLLFFVSLLNSAEILRECDTDIDCGSGYYCFLSYCERCIPCHTQFNRQPARSLTGQPICAKYEDDCGVCLPGYQANDLTHQRRSMTCFPLNETVSTSTDFWWTGIVWIASVLFLTVAFIVCFVKCRRVPAVSNNKDPGLLPSAPPLYSLYDAKFTDETDGLVVSEPVRSPDRVVIQENQGLCNEAIPAGYYDIFNNRLHDSDVEPEEGAPVPIHVAVDSEVDDESNQSTETIPSPWEPTSSMSDNSNNFFRSQSLERVPRPASTSQLVRLPSDPEILLSRRRIASAGESYSHRHVRLSQYRSESQTLNQTEPPKSMVDCESEDDLGRRDSSSSESFEDDQEPDAPESFLVVSDHPSFPSVILDVSWPRQSRALQNASRFLGSVLSEPSSDQGSQDSGFQDQSRRRSRTKEDLLEDNRIDLSAKKRRRNCSENE
ncbi:uncharacterized protein LOC130700185 [Daphnia carinata]|uniref:uncharacterized protein LOC130700185 n=1 Tax=Daphnia carinata TaxID=120202 RepID=UPI00257E7035|nr:uncharacterized protein LOC130700185 [Daphnia carinata]